MAKLYTILYLFLATAFLSSMSECKTSLPPILTISMAALEKSGGIIAMSPSTFETQQKSTDPKDLLDLAEEEINHIIQELIHKVAHELKYVLLDVKNNLIKRVGKVKVADKINAGFDGLIELFENSNHHHEHTLDKQTESVNPRKPTEQTIAKPSSWQNQQHFRPSFLAGKISTQSSDDYYENIDDSYTLLRENYDENTNENEMLRSIKTDNKDSQSKNVDSKRQVKERTDAAESLTPAMKITTTTENKKNPNVESNSQSAQRHNEETLKIDLNLSDSYSNNKKSQTTKPAFDWPKIRSSWRRN